MPAGPRREVHSGAELPELLRGAGRRTWVGVGGVDGDDGDVLVLGQLHQFLTVTGARQTVFT